MNENIIPGLASRRYVHKLASFAPLIFRDAFYNADEGVWYYYESGDYFSPLPDAESYEMYLSDSKTDAIDRLTVRNCDMYRRLYRGFPPAIMLKVIAYQSPFMMPFVATEIYFERRGTPIVTYQAICDFGDGHDGVQGKHILSLQVCVPDDRVDVWIGHFQVLPANPDCATVEDTRELRTLIADTDKRVQDVSSQANEDAGLCAAYVPAIMKIYNEWNPDTTSASAKFRYRKDIVYFPMIDTSKVTNMYYMFGECTALKYVPQLDTSSVTEMAAMFDQCTSLKSIPKIDTSARPRLSFLCAGCTSLTDVPEIDTSNVTLMDWMFANCTSLTTIPMLDMSSADNHGYMFYLDSSLRELHILNFGKNITAKNFTFSTSDSPWTIGLKESLLDNSFDRAAAGYPAVSVELSAVSMAALTDADKAAICAKGYTLTSK